LKCLPAGYDVVVEVEVGRVGFAGVGTEVARRSSLLFLDDGSSFTENGDGLISSRTNGGLRN